MMNRITKKIGGSEFQLAEIAIYEFANSLDVR